MALDIKGAAARQTTFCPIARESTDRSDSTSTPATKSVEVRGKPRTSNTFREIDASIEAEVATDPDIDNPVDGVPGLADSKCFALTPESSTPGFKFECYLLYDRYVAGTYSGDDADVRQRAAAQYALLAAP
jgi:hypothetical protein